MKTIKIPIYTTKEDKIFITKLQKQFSNSTRFSYNRILENIPLNQIEKDVKQLKNVELLDSWFIRCSTLKAKSMLESIKELNKMKAKDEEPINPQKVIFGTKYNFYQRLKNKIEEKEFKANRLMLINVQGELNQNGNRKFKLDLDNNQIKFKANRKNNIILNIPKLRHNFFKELRFIQEHKLLYSIELDTEFIRISFHEIDVKNIKNNIEYKKVQNRVLGIDLNPNYIGFSILDYKDGKTTEIIKKCYDLTGLNENLKVKSNDKKKIYQNNKRKFEILQIVKQIITESVHYKIDKIVIEDLKIITKDHTKGKNFNKLVNNQWMRKLITKKLNMLCNIFGIKLVEVNPAYSSFIGNLQYKYFDPVNSSIEIGRRGVNKFVKGSKLFPELAVKDLWKKHLTSEPSSWNDLYKKFENENIRYRVSLDESSEFYRLTSKKKCTNLYFFI